MSYPPPADCGPLAGEGPPVYPQAQLMYSQASATWHAEPVPGRVAAGPGSVLADRSARFGAHLLDLVFWFVAYFALGIPAMVWIDASGGGPAQAALIFWLIASFVLYFPLCVSRFGSTLGKRICGVRIVRTTTGGPIGFWRAAGREFFWVFAVIVPALGFLDPLWCCWDKPLQQCLHDKVAGTVTVRRQGE